MVQGIYYVVGTENNPPLLKPTFWTISDFTIPRTSNSVKAWHRRMGVLASRSHVSVYEMLDMISKESIIVCNSRQEILFAPNVSRRRVGA